MNNNNRGNNNNSNNNRRRGRGNNRPQGGGGGGGQPTNRIDSRARGNAPQMLEKFRKLAQDAHLNGDRVQSEYYLQFADHYFRVIADTRARQEEQRARRDERWQEGDAPREENDDSGEFSVESDFPSFDQPPPAYASRREREERQENAERAERPERNERPERAERPERNDRPERAERPERGERPERAERAPRREGSVRGERPEAGEEVGAEQQDTVEGGEARSANPYEPPENPFIRPNRNARGLRPRREDRQPRREESTEGEPLGLDPSSLPPAIAREEAPAPEAPADEVAEAKPRRRTRRKVADEGDTETVASVG